MDLTLGRDSLGFKFGECPKFDQILKMSSNFIDFILFLMRNAIWMYGVSLFWHIHEDYRNTQSTMTVYCTENSMSDIGVRAAHCPFFRLLNKRPQMQLVEKHESDQQNLEHHPAVWYSIVKPRWDRGDAFGDALIIINLKLTFKIIMEIWMEWLSWRLQFEADASDLKLRT